MEELSGANGAAERAVQTVEEQVRVVRHWLKISGKRPVMRRSTEHVGDLPSKYQVGEDDKTGYQRWKGKSTGTTNWSSAKTSTTAYKGDLDYESWSSDGLKALLLVKCGGARERGSSAHDCRSQIWNETLSWSTSTLRCRRVVGKCSKRTLKVGSRWR